MSYWASQAPRLFSCPLASNRLDGGQAARRSRKFRSFECALRRKPTPESASRACGPLDEEQWLGSWAKFCGGHFTESGLDEEGERSGRRELKPGDLLAVI